MRPKLASRGERTGARFLDTMQQETAKTQRALNANPFASGNLVTGLVFVGLASQVINHGLDRAPAGFIVVRSYGANGAMPVESGTQPPDRTKQIALTTSLNATLDIWFF